MWLNPVTGRKRRTAGWQPRTRGPLLPARKQRADWRPRLPPRHRGRSREGAPGRGSGDAGTARLATSGYKEAAPVAPRHHGGAAHYLGKRGALSTTGHTALPHPAGAPQRVRKRALAPPAGSKRDVCVSTCETARANQRLTGVRKFTESGAQGERHPPGTGNNRGHPTP